MIRKGLSLVEIIVAISVSAITLTTASVFSTRMLIKAQENFMDDSVSQLTSLVTEQLRLVEADMQYTVANRRNNPNNQSYPVNLGSPDDWNQVCNFTVSEVHLAINLPLYQAGTGNQPGRIVLQNDGIKLRVLQNVSPTRTPNGEFYFLPVDINSQMGAFYIYGQSGLKLAIKRSVDNSQVLGGLLVFQITTSYRIPNSGKVKYSDPVVIKMLQKTVCP